MTFSETVERFQYDIGVGSTRIKMTFLEAVKSGKKFKRKGEKHWCSISNTGDIIRHVDGESVLCYANYFWYTAEDFEVNEKWYEGDFKKKYPNGVLCKLYDRKEDQPIYDIVIDYIKDAHYPFRTKSMNYRRYAEPVSKKDAPAIIEGED